MGADIGIFIQYKKADFVLEKLKQLLTLGWHTNDFGSISYLPLGETEFGWKSVPCALFDSVWQELSAKIVQKEIVGLVLLFEQTEIGLNFLFDVNYNNIVLSLGINTKNIEDTTVTDFSWYLEKIKPLILDSNNIISVECRHYR